MHRPYKIKIVILGPLPPAIGGVATYIQYILASPLRKQYDFIPVRTMSRKHGTTDYHREKNWRKILRILSDFLNFISILMKESPQLVHINSSFNSGAFWRDAIYLAGAKAMGRKIFLQLHGGKLDVFLHGKSAFTRKIVLGVLSIPDMVGVLSKVQEQPILASKHYKKVTVIPNMIRASDYQENSDRPVPVDFPEGRKTVLYIASQFSKAKGVDEVLASVQRVSKRHKDILFVLVGGGKEKRQMIHECRRIGIADHVFFTGFLSKEQIVPILHAADIFILPSHSEGFPYVILEAMSSGLPVIATPVGAIPELIQEGKNGYLVNVGDSVRLADYIDILLRNKSLREKMGEYNRRLVLEKYDIHSMVNHFSGCYDRILNGMVHHHIHEIETGN